MILKNMALKKAILKKASAVALCAGLSLWAELAAADEYRASEFLGLDLSKAVLSPKPLGPPAQFAPVPIEDSSGSDAFGNPGRQVRAEPKGTPGRIAPRIRTAHTQVKPARGAARTRLARRHSNPLDAEAFDTRIQVWPCNTGGICNWQRR